MRTRKLYQTLLIVVVLVTAMFIGTGQTWAAVTPPDLTVCDNVTCENLPYGTICSSEGFKITVTGFQPANTSDNSTATYTYEICSPAAGTCSNDSSKSCEDNSGCWQNRCQAGGPNAGTCSQDNSTPCTTAKVCNVGVTCSRECTTDEFHDLSHFDVTFPPLIGSCLSSTTAVTGTCSNGDFVLGDGSCFTSTYPVAKCDNTNLNPGDCLDMTVSIAGENTSLGQGAAVIV